MANKGALTLASTFALPANAKPYGSATYSNNLYVVDNTSGASLVYQLAIDPSTGAPSQIPGKALSLPAGSLSRWVAVAPDGKNVYVLSTGGSGVFIFTRDLTDGSLTFFGNLANTNSYMAVPNGIAISPDNNHVYITCRDTGRVLQLLRNTSTGALSFLGTPYVITAATSPQNCQGIAITVDGTGVYVCSTNALYCFTRDPVTGLLSPAPTPSIATSSSFPDAVAITDDGLFVYVAADSGNQFTDCFPRSSDNSLGTKLTPPGNTSDNNGGPWGLALSKDAGNTTVYVAISDVQKIAQYNRNTTSGALTFKTPGSVTTSNRGLASPQGGGGGGPYSVTVSGDNKYLFATAMGTGAVDVFMIDQGVVATTPVYQDYIGTFDVLAPVYRDFTGTFDVRASVFRDYVGTFDVLAKVSRDFVGTFDVRQQVFRDFVGTFDVAGVAGPIDVSKISPARIVVFEGSGSRVVVFEGSGPRVRFDQMSAIVDLQPRPGRGKPLRS
jgi:6-phosphogluconolactonase (cycloisomerase 2 family)